MENQCHQDILSFTVNTRPVPEVILKLLFFCDGKKLSETERKKQAMKNNTSIKKKNRKKDRKVKNGEITKRKRGKKYNCRMIERKKREEESGERRVRQMKER